MTVMEDWRRIGAWCGIVFVILFIVGGAIQADVPMADKPADEIRAYFTDNGDQYIVGDFFFGLAFVFFFLPFASALTAYLAASEGNPPVWSRLVLIAAAIITAVGGGLGAVQGGLAYGAVDALDDGSLEALIDTSYYGFTVVFNYATALLVFCASMVILRKGLLWNWLGWLGLAYAIAAIVGFFAVLSDDPTSGLGILNFIVLIVFGVWTLVVSYGMLTKETAAA
jgi:hypothetical protein